MTYVLVFLSLAVAAVAVWAVRVYRLRRWLKAATVEDVVKSRYFRSRMAKEIIALNNKRAYDEVKAHELNGTLKSHPIEHLQDEGVWNAVDMSFLYLHFLQKTLIGYSQADRRFIGDVGRLVYLWTVGDLCRRAFIKQKKVGAS
jgi:hypothetical protein